MPDLSESSIEYFSSETYDTERPDINLTESGLQYFAEQVIIYVLPVVGPSQHGDRPQKI